ncbi:unnamed protein product [Prunus brigantina]
MFPYFQSLLLTLPFATNSNVILNSQGSSKSLQPR